MSPSIGFPGTKLKYLGFHRKNARVLVAKRVVMLPGIPYMDRGNWGWECDSLCYHVLATRKQQHLQNAVLCEDCFAKTSALYAHLTYRHTRCSWKTTLNDVEHFRNWPGHEFYSLKAGKLTKCANFILVFTR